MTKENSIYNSSNSQEREQTQPGGLREAIRRHRHMRLEQVYQNNPNIFSNPNLRFTESERVERAHLIKNSLLVEDIIDLTERGEIQWTASSEKNNDEYYTKTVLGQSDNLILVLSQTEDALYRHYHGDEAIVNGVQDLKEGRERAQVYQLSIFDNQEEVFLTSQLNASYRSTHVKPWTEDDFSKVARGLQELYKTTTG